MKERWEISLKLIKQKELSKYEIYLLDALAAAHDPMDCETAPCQTCSILMAFDPDYIYDEDPRRVVLHDRAKKIRKILDMDYE